MTVAERAAAMARIDAVVTEIRAIVDEYGAVVLDLVDSIRTETPPS